MNKLINIILFSLIFVVAVEAAGPTLFRDVLVKNGLKIGGTGFADDDAALEINSTTKGFLPPRMDETARDAISSPATGLVVYNTDDDKLNVYDGSAWVEVGSSGVGGDQLNLITGDDYNMESSEGSWGASGGTTTHETASPLIGSGSVKHTAGSGGQELVLSGVVIPASYEGYHCQISIPIYLATADYLLSVFDTDSSANIVEDVVISATSNSTVVSFLCPVGPVNISLIANSAGSITLDEFFLGVGKSSWNWSADGIKTFSAKLNCDAGSAITSQLISQTLPAKAVASIGNVSGGACAVTLAADFFSATPYCTVSVDAAFASVGLIVSANATSATAVSLDCENDASTACTAYDVVLRCEGR